MTILRDPRLWGAGAFALLATLGIVAAMVYVSPPGDKVVTFYTDDASSITPGITVRIAGITVGTVKDLIIEPEQVKVHATVKGSAFVGDQSTVAVRMLTVVGGYYVNIDSLGDTALGDRAIAREQVTLPYSLIRALTDTIKITQNVQTAPVNATLDQVQRGLTGSNLESLSSIVAAGSKLTETLDRQSGQLSAILNVTDEYIYSLATHRSQLQELVRKVSILEQTLVLYGKGFSAALLGLGNIVQGLGPVGEFYLNHRDKFLTRFIHAQQTIRAWADRSGLVVRILQRTRDRMEATLDVQHAPPELLATDLCIPLPESPC